MIVYIHTHTQIHILHEYIDIINIYNQHLSGQGIFYKEIKFEDSQETVIRIIIVKG